MHRPAALGRSSSEPRPYAPVGAAFFYASVASFWLSAIRASSLPRAAPESIA